LGRFLGTAGVILAVSLTAAAGAASAGSHTHAATPRKCRQHRGKCHRKQRAVTTPSAAPTTTTAAAPTQDYQGSPPSEYIALGDSITAGYSATEGSDYVSLLFAHYRNTLGVDELANFGKPGETSTSLLGSQLSSALAGINGPSDTKVVTIDIGLNDYFGDKCTFGSDPCTQTFEANFSSALSQIQAALDADPGPEPLIALAYYNTFSGTGTDWEWAMNTVLFGQSMSWGCTDTGSELGLNDAIAQIAGHYGAEIANTYAAFQAAGQSYIDQNTLHPNDAGHRAIADAVIAAAQSPCT
jgi:lysophospholipase L1-like esterase